MKKAMLISIILILGGGCKSRETRTSLSLEQPVGRQHPVLKLEITTNPVPERDCRY